MPGAPAEQLGRGRQRAHREGGAAALVGPLGTVAAAQELRPLRDRLAHDGCRPLVALLEEAVADGRLPAGLDVVAATAALEGPVFYRSLVRDEQVPSSVAAQVVDDFLRLHAADAG